MKNFKDINKQAIQAAYFEIIKQAKQLISTITEEPLRGILERQDEPSEINGYIVHELINPLIYIRLECLKGNIFTIHYGYEQTDLYSRFYPITCAFIRAVYHYTSKENTSINIENCVRTDWVIINCAELYEYIGDRNDHHTFTTLRLIKTANMKGRKLEMT